MLPRLNPNRPFLSGWTKRKKFTVTSDTDVKNDALNFTIFNTSGTDTTTTVYLNGNVRSDWGDVRLTRADGLTRIPFAILVREATFINIGVSLNVRNGDTEYFLYYDGPVADIYKIASITDVHYDTGTDLNDRDNALTYIDNFKTRMTGYVPDLVVCNGDMMGASSSVEATQLAWMEAVADQLTGVTGTLKRFVALGNHDFEYASATNVRALMDDYEAWMEASVMYGQFHETDDFIFLSLDSNYDSTDDTHLTTEHVGYGYLNGTQISWLQQALEDADKDVIIFCHHPLCEADTNQWTLTKELYHVQNRKEVRAILEQSGKVVAVIHGHTHFSRVDVIKGIPYILTGNLTNDANNNPNLAFGELPASSDGRWDLIEFDLSSRVIRQRREILVSGDYETLYDFFVPFGQTSFSSDLSHNPELTFRFNYGGAFKKSSYLRDPIQMYLVDADNIRKFPYNEFVPEAGRQGAIRVQGMDDDPNFGRALWWFDTQSANFNFQFSVLARQTNSSFYIKLGSKNTTGAPEVYLSFKPDGNITSWGRVTGTPTEFTLQSYAADTWYDIQLFINPSTKTYSVKIDNTSYSTARSFFTNVYTSLREVEFVTETGNFWIHNVRIKKRITANTAIGSFEAEETL